MRRIASTAALLAAAAGIAAAAPAGAVATNFTISMTGNMADNGTYGNVLTLQSTSTSGAVLNAKVTGWQGNQSNNAITSAYVGKYSPGLGVTGLGDSNGANGYHQIDNAFGYWDFILIQFDREVKLSSADLNSFQMTGFSSKDNDFGYYNAGAITTAAWDSTINLASGYSFAPTTWTNLLGTGADGSRTIGTSVASSKWLIGAGVQYSTNGVSNGVAYNDGFKLASINVTADVPAPPSNVGAVPEPATWGTMILGFALVGAAARRGRRSSPASVTA